MKIQVSVGDLVRIFDQTKFNFIDKDNRQLDGREFTVRCYLEACVDFLNRSGVSDKIELEFDVDRKQDLVRDDD